MLAVADNHRLAKLASLSVAQIGSENFAVYVEADGRANIAGAMASLLGLPRFNIGERYSVGSGPAT